MERSAERRDHLHGLQQEANLLYGVFECIRRDLRSGDASTSETLVALRDVIDGMRIIMDRLRTLIEESDAAT